MCLRAHWVSCARRCCQSVRMNIPSALCSMPSLFQSVGAGLCRRQVSWAGRRAADADGANDLAVNLKRDTADRGRQVRRQSRDEWMTMFHCVEEIPRWPLEHRRGARFPDRDLIRRVKRAVHSFEINEAAGGIDDSEDVQVRTLCCHGKRRGNRLFGLLNCDRRAIRGRRGWCGRLLRVGC